ncbi:MAG: PTS sugar transporter subunit IIA [Acidobacteriota bacterium]
MIGGIIITHGELGKELLNVLSYILGETPPIEALSLGWFDDADKAKKQIKDCIKRVNKGNGVIIFTDMFGGTPSNISFSFLKENEIEIITGTNLPMLIKFSSIQNRKNLKDVAEEIRNYGFDSIQLASSLLNIKK